MRKNCTGFDSYLSSCYWNPFVALAYFFTDSTRSTVGNSQPPLWRPTHICSGRRGGRKENKETKHCKKDTQYLLSPFFSLSACPAPRGQESKSTWFPPHHLCLAFRGQRGARSLSRRGNGRNGTFHSLSLPPPQPSQCGGVALAASCLPEEGWQLLLWITPPGRWLLRDPGLRAQLQGGQSCAVTRLVAARQQKKEQPAHHRFISCRKHSSIYFGRGLRSHGRGACATC